MKLYTDDGRNPASLGKVFVGGKWKWRLSHRYFGGNSPSRSQYSEYASEANALRAFERMYT